MVELAEELRKRVEQYISTVERALEAANRQSDGLSEQEERVLALSRMYLEDSKYYYSKDDLVTALATVSYAEGLIDALNMLGKLNVRWEKPRRKKVLAAGTFDILHPGHLRFLEKASSLGDLYVIVSRKHNAERAKKRPIVMPDEARLALVGSLKYVKKAVLGDEEDILKNVVEISPDVIVLGPDQAVNEDKLREELARRGLRDVEVVRLAKRFDDVWPNSSTQVIEVVAKLICNERREAS